MDDKLNILLTELLELIENDSRMIYLKELRNDLFNNSEFISLLNKTKSNLYISVDDKEKIFSNPKYKEYQHLENEILFLVLEINKKLNKLADKSRCY